MCALAQAAPATSASAPSDAKERLSERVGDYFAGEKTGAFVFAGSGATQVAFGAYLVTRDEDKPRSAAYPLFVTGGLQLLAGVLVAATADGDAAERKLRLASDRQAFQREELARMEGVMSRFWWAIGLELAATAAGLTMALYGELQDKDVVAGVGLGLAAGSAQLLCLEVLTRQRSLSYVAALRSSMELSLLPGGAALGLRRRY